MRGIDAAGFTTCTPIQAKALPVALAGKDVAGQAQTGTGKTAAFLISTFTRLLKRPRRDHGPRALVVAPTRELVVQILHDAEVLGQFTGLTFQAVYGGVDYAKQRELLRAGVDILVGTPGRLIDYYKQRVYTLRHAEVLVIDEADRMFDMGFIADLRFLLRRLPPYDQRQSMLFSATLNWDVMELAYEHMNDPVKVAVEPEKVTAEKVEHVLYHVGRHEKFPLLLGLLQRERPERTLMFVNTKREAEWLTQRLADNHFHAGASGKALTLACESYVMALEPIEALIGFRLPVVHVEDDMLVKPVPPSRAAHGHRRRPVEAPGRNRPRGDGRGASAPPPDHDAGRRRRRRRRGAAPAPQS